MAAAVDISFWSNKRVFITGHTGFKGSWLSFWLQSLAAQVKGFSLQPPTSPSMFDELNIASGMESEIGDIRDPQAIAASIIEFDPEILIHMAAQPLVRLSYSQPAETYATNVMGTVNVLEAARQCAGLKAIINVTTDKCYENREWVWGYRENDAMGGHDPYSSSKGCAELVTSAYRDSFFCDGDGAVLASARAGNVIGGGDWSDDRLVPDILSAFAKAEPVIVRNPLATRPWQHVLEPLSGYLILAQNLYKDGASFAEGWNFGPRDEDVKPVNWILDEMARRWGDGASWELDTESQPLEAQLLKLDISKASDRLNWYPRWTVHQALDSIIDWHQTWLKKGNLREKTMEQISLFESL